MQYGSHRKTLISMLREAVEEWRKRNRWSRETVSQGIVEAHQRINGPTVTGIDFDPPSSDPFDRVKANADRIFRWLDDVTKDRNQLPPNFIPSILAALPQDLLIALVNDLLRPLRLGSHQMPTEIDDSDSTVMLFKGVVAGSGLASAAMADLLDGVDPGELAAAQLAFAEAQARLDAAKRRVELKISSEGRP